MDIKEVEKCCCVVKLSEALSANKPVSCSGVIVHPQTGTVICSGLPFSRFIADKDVLTSDTEFSFLPPRTLSDKLKIRVCLPLDTSKSTHSRPKTRRHQNEVSAQLLMLVNCPEFKQAFQALFREAEQWRFHGDEEDAELIRDAHFLSWFAVLKTGVVVGSSPDSGTIPWQSSSPLQKGSHVVACGSPFGSLCLDLFISTLSRGIISNLAGEDNAVILTDARCLPGTEGGGLFLMGGADDVRLIGLIVSPFGWKANEWIGLSLVCSVHSIFRNILRCSNSQDPLCDVCLHQGETGLQMMTTTAHESKAVKYPTVCFVESGELWGSGVVVTPRLVLTCRHVVNGKSTVNLKFHHRNRVFDSVGDVLFSTKASSPYDLALVRLRSSVLEAVVPRMAQSFNPGESVVVVGYGGLGRSCGPSLTSGVLSKAVSRDKQPVMLQTTCAVQAGASGGAVVRTHTGELLGIVSSNTRDLAAKVTYPHLNFSIPVTVFQRLLQRFHQTQEVNVFRTLDTTEKQVVHVWRLQEVSKL
ncbi:peroxisomal leader peptide-processing protease [Solea senegalensis]|uniref:Peroxisomal leader peptide-processing protease n=1 Tax=Solea senegalensis TaxID=28829 RepID=A0AAV6S699_SOLSE|nr:peroxisomal leader peptide-processing protease [Solea senegalensis]KAG7512858.1 peroxisomal leader peptide-processing protease [Solea senegalensis]